MDHLRDPQPRIIFSDKYGTVGPWFFEQTRDGDYDWSDEVLTSRIWPGQSVYLRNYQTGEYVTASMEGLSITVIYDENSDDTIGRLFVSATPKPVQASKWRVMYNPHRDDGFRLWNSEANCFLATSYRTFPNLRDPNPNSTILQTLNLELEACCTFPASREASTFYAIDGVEKPSIPSTWLPSCFGQFIVYETYFRGYFSFTIGILRVMFDVYQFRQRHAAVQQMSSELIMLHIGVPYTESWARAFVAVVAGSIIFSLSQAMYTKRRGSSCLVDQINRKRFSSSASQVQFCFLLFFILKAMFSREQLWDCHFVLGVALIHTVDRLGYIIAYF